MPQHSSNMHSARYSRFVRQLVKARQDAALTQTEVAKLLKKPQSYISKCELGERRLDFTELEEFARIYRKPLDFFKTL